MMVTVTKAMLGQDSTYDQFWGTLRYRQMNTPMAVRAPENLVALQSKGEIVSRDCVSHRHIRVTCRTDATHQIFRDCPLV